MSLSDEIKKAIAPFLGLPLTPQLTQEIKRIVIETAIANQSGILSYEIEVTVKQAQIYLGLKLMVDSIQSQIDTLNAQVAALQTSIATINASLDGLTIGSDVQAWDSALQAIADMTLTANQLLGTNNASQLIQYPLQRRLVGSPLFLPYDPASATGWAISGAIYTDPEGWLWYLPNGTSLSNAQAKYLNLYLALWGTAAYTIAGGKGANAQADWDAGKSLIIPDMRGRALSSNGTASGGATSRAIGSVWGTEQATLTSAQLPTHNHRVSVTNITATGIAGSAASGLGVISNGNATIATIQSNIIGNRSANNDGLGAIADTGGTGSPLTTQPFNISDPTKAYIELWWMNTK